MPSKPRFAIGVDLGGTNLRIAAVGTSGEVLEKITTGTEVKRGRDEVISEMSNAIRQLADKHASSQALIGIGIGVPGIIDMDSGTILESPNLPGWHDYHVQREIEKRLGSKVILENDANAAALGEKWLGAGRHTEDMCMLTLGTGVGGGIVLGGKVWHGMTGMAGELGHTTVDEDGVQCLCGNRGCVEQYASATAIKRLAMESIAAGNASDLARAMHPNHEISSKLVYQAALQGDPAAQHVFRRVGSALGVVIAGMINVLNLPMYVVGGGVSNAWDAFAPAMFAEVRRRSFVYAATEPEAPETYSKAVPAKPQNRRVTMITRSVLGGDAGLLGAARLTMLDEK